MDFKSWLKKRRVTNTPVGDFVADAKDDTHMPDDIFTHER